MWVTENIFNHYCNAKNDTHINKYWLEILEECTWSNQIANLYKNLLKMSNVLKKADLQDTKELI